MNGSEFEGEREREKERERESFHQPRSSESNRQKYLFQLPKVTQNTIYFYI